MKKTAILCILSLCCLSASATGLGEPYITISRFCSNHGMLEIRAEIVNRTNGFEEFLGGNAGIRLLASERNGATIDLHYGTDDAEIVLRKTVMQNGHPWANPRCYLVPLLASSGSDIQILRSLLTGADDEEIPLEGGGTARLHMNRQR